MAPRKRPDIALRIKRNKQRALEYLGSKCVKCGSIYNLEYDHIDPKTKSFSIGSKWQASFETLKKELDKCQLLCIPCHKEKTKLNNEQASKPAVEHGQGRSGKRHCRCKPCVARKAFYYKVAYDLGHNPSDKELKFYEEWWGWMPQVRR